MKINGTIPIQPAVVFLRHPKRIIAECIAALHWTSLARVADVMVCVTNTGDSPVTNVGREHTHYTR
jgi:hypothetical protein